MAYSTPHNQQSAMQNNSPRDGVPAQAQPNHMRISSVLGRLEQLLDLENEKIGKDVHFDIAASSTQKSRCLYEMATLLKSCNENDMRADHQALINLVRDKLAINKKKLEAHMEAVRGIADMLKEAAQTAEDDGTYSANQFGAEYGGQFAGGYGAYDV